MAPAAPRATSHFHSSKLIRLLTQLSNDELAAADAGIPSVAEQLGSWLGWADAIALSAALSGGPAVSEDVATKAPWPAQALGEEVARVQAALARAVTTDEVLAPRQVRAAPSSPPVPGATPSLPGDSVIAFAPLRRSHAAHQHAMASSIALLRAQVRATLTAVSPKLGRLAALDAVMEDTLSARERSLLATVTPWLENHFDRQCRAHTQLAGPTQAPDGLWWAARAQEVQAVLLAELEIRWQPVDGLMQALNPAITRPA